jgi:hypothetical protein
MSDQSAGRFIGPFKPALLNPAISDMKGQSS